MSRIVYSSKYNIGFYGLERLHPFDSRKYGRSWRLLKQHFGSTLSKLHVRPPHAATARELNLVHPDKYLLRLKDPQYIAGALELPQLRWLPIRMIDWHVLRPMRWATKGTIVAATEALNHGFAVNLSGGYHHAKPDHGEGFSIYADVGVAIAYLREQQLINDKSRIVYVDTDAHQGNGICHTFMSDNRVFIFDIFNCHIYPIFDVEARRRIDCEIGVNATTTDEEYMRELKRSLPGFLDSVGRSKVDLAVYNAGTDVVSGDPLGALNVSPSTVQQRDEFVVGELRKRGIPTVMVLSGGYTRQSYELVAKSVISLIQNELARV